MRFKDKRQHNKKVDPVIEVLRDKFNNITVVAKNGDFELRENYVSEIAIDKVTKKLIKRLK
jgi:hypothetical protein